MRYVCGVRVLDVQSADQRICPNCGKAIVLHRVLRHQPRAEAVKAVEELGVALDALRANYRGR